MSRVFALILLLASSAYGSQDMSDFPFELNEKEIIYRLIPPKGFDRLEIAIHLSGKVNNTITDINIDTGTSIYKVDASQLNIEFAPNLREIRFHKIGTKEKYDSIFFDIYHGAPKKIECGKDQFEYVQKSVKVTVFPSSEPLVENDNSYIESCERLTRYDNDHQE